MSVGGPGQHTTAAWLSAALFALAVPWPAATAAPPPMSGPFLPSQPMGPPLQIPPPAAPPSRPFSKPAEGQITSLAQLDAAIDRLHQTIWQLHSMFGPLQDVRGRTAAQDVDQWLLTPEREARLTSLRATALTQSAKGDQRKLSATLDAAATLLEQEAYRSGMLSTYWVLCSLTEQHVANMRPLAPGLSLAAPVGEPAIDVAAEGVAKQMEEAMGAESVVDQAAEIVRLNTGRADLLRALNETRARYAARRSEQQRSQGQEESGYPRDTPCPQPVTQTSGREKAGIAEGNQAPDSFYPDSSRLWGYEGSVTVKAWVSAAGCMQKARIYTSSGVEALDDAAIRWTQQAHFRPAEHDHHAVDGTLLFVIKFQLRE